MNNELYHHGIKGMRWGVRRTPAQLGHKPKSQKDRAKERAKKIAADAKEEARKIKRKQAAQAIIDKAKAKADAKLDRAKNGKPKAPKEPPKKTVKDMSDAEIRDRINRIRLENELKSLTPENVSRGKRFVRSAIDDVIAPAARSAGKELLTNWFKKKGTEMLGLDADDAKDSLAALKKQAEEAKLRQTIATANKIVRADRKEAKAEADAKAAEEKEAKDAAEKEAAAKKEAKAAEKAAKEVEQVAKKEAKAAEKEDRRLEKLAQRAIDDYEKTNKKFSLNKNVEAGEDYLNKLMRQEEAYLDEIIRKRNLS